MHHLSLQAMGVSRFGSGTAGDSEAAATGGSANALAIVTGPPSAAAAASTALCPRGVFC
jgi:hypothetical protein